MSGNARVGMEGLAPEILIGDEEFTRLAVKEQRRIKGRNRRWRLMESLKKLKAKVQAEHRDSDKYLERIADIEDELGLSEQPPPQEGKQEGGG